MIKFTPLFILSLSATLLMVGVGMIVALLPQKVFAATGTLESVGLIASVFALAYLLAQIPVGVLSDRFGPKKFLGLGYIICGIAGLVFYSAQNANTIYIGRAIQGIGEAPIWALGPAVLSLAYPDAKGRVIGIYNAAIHAGLTLGPLLGLLIAPIGEGRAPFVVFASLCFCASAIVLLGLSRNIGRTHISRTRVSPRQLIEVLSQRKVAVTLFGIILYGAGYGVFVSVLPISLTSSHGFGPVAIAWFFVLFYAAISFAQLIAGPMSDRFGRWVFMMWGMAAAAIGITTFLGFSGFWVFAPLGLASAGLGVFCVTSIAALNECVSENLKGAISGVYYFFWAVGYMFGPLLMGSLASTLPLIGYLTMGLAMAMYSITVRWVRR